MSEKVADFPLHLKLAFTLFMGVWVPAVWVTYTPYNFLWFCDVSNFVVLVALWRGSSLLISSQAVGVLLFQLLWTVDYFGRLLLGFHPIGGTEYMLDPSLPLAVRALSLFHVAVPVLLLWAVRRVGYHPRGWLLQTALIWLLLPVSWLVGPELNLNWTWNPFEIEQVWLPPLVYLLVAMVLLPLVVFYPTHRLLASWAD